MSRARYRIVTLGEEGALSLRILFADDQLPPDSVDDDSIDEYVRNMAPDASTGSIRAFHVMRQTLRTLKDCGYTIVTASKFADALQLAREQKFDVAIVDLGWYFDRELPNGEDPGSAGWAIARAIDARDKSHPEQASTPQIMNSARLSRSPDIAITAAREGRLPFLKPYGEPFSAPLNLTFDTPSRSQQVEASNQLLRATLAFVEQLLGANPERQRLLAFASASHQQAHAYLQRWDLLARVLSTLGICVILVGVVASFFFGLAQGIVTTTSGVVVSVIPQLLYGQLEKNRVALRESTSELYALLESDAAT